MVEPAKVLTRLLRIRLRFGLALAFILRSKLWQSLLSQNLPSSSSIRVSAIQDLDGSPLLTTPNQQDPALKRIKWILWELDDAKTWLKSVLPEFIRREVQ
ncbi:hypothetical protein HGRIS_001525 [Hohenbuehelia grisea]|uniref:Uncharacterized protein n=1 Tax=Hohenbuehelia grisea TaxID=104357 RepID=A0ABR3JPR5_9AGAR